MLLKATVKGLAIALVALGILFEVSSAPTGADHRVWATARVLNTEGRAIGFMVNGQLRPHPSAVQSVDLVQCWPAIEHGPIWAFCRDGFHFSNIFEYRKYMAAKRALAAYTGPVVIEVAGRKSQSYLEDGWLR